MESDGDASRSTIIASFRIMRLNDAIRFSLALLAAPAVFDPLVCRMTGRLPLLDGEMPSSPELMGSGSFALAAAATFALSAGSGFAENPFVFSFAGMCERGEGRINVDFSAWVR